MQIINRPVGSNIIFKARFDPDISAYSSLYFILYAQRVVFVFKFASYYTLKTISKRTENKNTYMVATLLFVDPGLTVVQKNGAPVGLNIPDVDFPITRGFI